MMRRPGAHGDYEMYRINMLIGLGVGLIFAGCSKEQTADQVGTESLSETIQY